MTWPSTHTWQQKKSRQQITSHHTSELQTKHSRKQIYKNIHSHTNTFNIGHDNSKNEHTHTNTHKAVGQQPSQQQLSSRATLGPNQTPGTDAFVLHQVVLSGHAGGFVTATATTPPAAGGCPSSSAGALAIAQHRREDTPSDARRQTTAASRQPTAQSLIPGTLEGGCRSPTGPTGPTDDSGGGAALPNAEATHNALPSIGLCKGQGTRLRVG